jgi:antirestriction protein ArdC
MRNLCHEVTNRILNELQAGVVPWRKPWGATPGLNVPCNAVTGREYHGVNKVLLWLTRSKGWVTPRFLTFNQALELGGHVRKGEHGIRIYFVKELKFAEQGEGQDEADVRSVRMLREYTVFNVAQCEGLPTKITEPPVLKPRHGDARNPEIEEFIATTGAKIREDGDNASSIPSLDIITMPPFTAFDSASAYYGTLFHELAHWTGHKSRLNRKLEQRFDKAHKVAEELIAELTAAFLCAEFSINGDPGMPAYIGSYVQLLEDDDKAFFTCCSKAQAALDFLRDLVLREPKQAAE